MKRNEIASMTGMGVLHKRLHGGLWHTTHPDRFLAILASGGLRTEPDIPNSERWKASQPKYYPFVRHIGGISLFDFFEFAPESYQKQFPLSNWYEFVPHRQVWGGAVWIEIDRQASSRSLLTAEQLRESWDQDGKRQHTRMPQIEVAHIGDLSKTSFRSAFLTWAAGNEVREFDPLDGPAFSILLDEWRAAISR